jgi:dTDP-4-dehydrorhamnose reductase
MRLLVTGAGGMLGRATVAEARRLGHDVKALTHAELDIADAAAVGTAVLTTEPRAVINCAGWTDVDGAESDPEGALAVNGSGAGNLASAARDVGAFIVHVSTDYVFDGRGQRPYVESDPTDPQSEYGRSKLAGELAVRASGAEYAIARTAWLFGVGGRNFVETMLSLAAARDEVSVVTDQLGCPTFAGHLAPALIELAERREAGIHHLAGAGACTWNEFAVEIFAQTGVYCRVLPTTSDAVARPAPRPSYSVLDSERPDPIVLPPWQEGLRAYLEARADHAESAIASRPARERAR